MHGLLEEDSLLLMAVVAVLLIWGGGGLDCAHEAVVCAAQAARRRSGPCSANRAVHRSGMRGLPSCCRVLCGLLMDEGRPGSVMGLLCWESAAAWRGIGDLAVVDCARPMGGDATNG